jgi:hypothetical protein
VIEDEIKFDPTPPGKREYFLKMAEAREPEPTTIVNEALRSLERASDKAKRVWGQHERRRRADLQSAPEQAD